MTFLNSPKRFVVPMISSVGCLVFESIKKATHAVLVRRNARSPWEIYDVYESLYLAEETRPTRLKEHHELALGEIEGTAVMQWENYIVRGVEGFVHPIVWHGEDRNKAEDAGLIPSQDEIEPTLGDFVAMMESVNKYRAILKLPSWVIDNTAMKPGFYMLYEGNPGKKFGHPNGIGEQVQLKALDARTLERFLNGAILLAKEAAALTYQPTNIDLDNEELEYLRGQLTASSPQLRWKIDQAIRQAKKNKE